MIDQSRKPQKNIFSDPLMNAYLDHVQFEKRLASRTCALYVEDLKKLSELLLESKIDSTQATSAHFRSWLARMNTSGRSPRGIALILSGWRGFYSWLGRQGKIKVNPLTGLRSPKVPKPLPKALSVDDAVMLTNYKETKKDKKEKDAAFEDKGWLEARDAAMVELLYSSGLRVSELVSLDIRPTPGKRPSWIDFEEGEAHVVGKGSKERTVPVGGKALNALSLWLNVRDLNNKSSAPNPVNTALFIGRNGTRLTPQSVWQRLRRRSLGAGLSTPVHPHMLRHSFASHVLQSSSDLRGVQELLGHANISTTQVYTRLDFQHLAKAYDAAHPRAFKKGGGSKEESYKEQDYKGGKK